MIFSEGYIWIPLILKRSSWDVMEGAGRGRERKKERKMGSNVEIFYSMKNLLMRRKDMVHACVSLYRDSTGNFLGSESLNIFTFFGGMYLSSPSSISSSLQHAVFPLFSVRATSACVCKFMHVAVVVVIYVCLPSIFLHYKSAHGSTCHACIIFSSPFIHIVS